VPAGFHAICVWQAWRFPTPTGINRGASGTV
jgi:hypothetical protein